VNVGVFVCGSEPSAGAIRLKFAGGVVSTPSSKIGPYGPDPYVFEALTRQ
jgi:hypothetical protein